MLLAIFLVHMYFFEILYWILVKVSIITEREAYLEYTLMNRNCKNFFQKFCFFIVDHPELNQYKKLANEEEH